jgi:hypothetical protein
MTQKALVRTYAVAAAFATCLVGGATQAGAVPEPSRAATVATSSAHPILFPVTGSDSELVYIAQRSDADGNPAIGEAASRLTARDRNGHTRVLETGNATYGYPEIANLRIHSMVGRWLVARLTGAKPTAEWWNVATGTHGRIALPKHVDVLTAAPGGGVIYMSRDGRVHEVPVHGRPRLLGRPFTTEPGAYYDDAEETVADFVSANDKGIVLGGADADIRYIAFAHPGVVHRLTDPIGHEQFCRAVNDSYTACIAIASSDDGPEAAGVALVPLDGSTPTIASDALAAPQGVGLHGKRMIWVDRAPLTVDNGVVGWHVASMSARGHAPAVGTQLIDRTTAAAYDGLVATDPTRAHLRLATASTTVSDLT